MNVCKQLILGRDYRSGIHRCILQIQRVIGTESIQDLLCHIGMSLRCRMDLLSIFHAEVVQFSGKNRRQQRVCKAVEFDSADFREAVIIFITVGIGSQSAHILVGNDGCGFHQLTDVKRRHIRQFHFLESIIETDIDNGRIFVQFVDAGHQFGINVHPFGDALDHCGTVNSKGFGKCSDSLSPVQNKDQKACQTSAHLQDLL